MTALRAEGCGIAAFGGDEYKVSVTGILSSLCFRHPKHGGELATFGGFPPLWCLFFLARRAVVRFSHGRSPVLKVFYKLAAKPPTTTLTARGRVKP